MTSCKRLLLAALTAAVTLIITGCATRSEHDTSIPWSRPATWEGQVPGMGTTPGMGR